MLSFQHRATDEYERSWFPSEFPHLVRDSNIFPVLYDMNVNSYNAPWYTGICLPVALFVKHYMKDVHNTDVEMVGLWEDRNSPYTQSVDIPPIFCHCVIKYNNKFHDAFWPEGTQDESKILFAGDCFYASVDSVVDMYLNHQGSAFLNENLFDKLKASLYNSRNLAENNFLNLEQV